MISHYCYYNQFLYFVGKHYANRLQFQGDLNVVSYSQSHPIQDTIYREMNWFEKYAEIQNGLNVNGPMDKYGRKC